MSPIVFMRSLGILFAASWLMVAGASGQTADRYLNRGVVTNAQVDAIEFINQGRFLIETPDIPWNSQSTRDFTNQGEMGGFVGFDFLTITPEGERLPARSFNNTRTGRIFSFADLSFFLFSGGGGGNFIFGSDNSFMLVNADTIVNRGNIAVDSTGLIQLTGKTVDLASSTLLVDPNLNQSLGFGFGFFDFFITPTNFIGDPGIFDLAWGLGNNTNVNQASISSGSGTFISPLFQVTNKFSSFAFCRDSLFLSGPSWTRVNSPTPTNVTVEVVVVQVPSTNISVDVRFVPSLLPNFDTPQDDYTCPTIQLSALSTNVIDLSSSVTSYYVVDQTGASTNVNLLENLAAPGFRPGPLIVTKFQPPDWSFGFSSNFVFSAGLFNDPQFTNAVVTNFYSVYAAEISSLATPLPFLPDVGASNASGRVEIQADTLDLRNTRIRGEGLVSIQATNFLSSDKAVIDSSSLNYDLTVPAVPGSTQPLRFQSLAPDLVERFAGNIIAFGSVWTNVLTPTDTNLPSVEFHFHLTMVDATGMHTEEPALVHHLKLTGPQGVEINDNLHVTDDYEITSPAVTINGALNLRKGLLWDQSHFSGLQSLTNNGAITTADLVTLGNSPADSLPNFVNHGAFAAYSYTINASNFVNTGSLTATNFFEEIFTNFCYGTVITFTNSEPSVGPVEVNAQQALFSGGTVATDGDIYLNGGVFKFRGTLMSTHGPTNQAGGRITLNVTDTLTDSGADAGNHWVMGDGFHMAPSGVKPGGDLLGTWMSSDASPFAIIEHSWGGKDVGAVSAGYQNNLAIGRLTLTGATNSVFEFYPTGAKNAIYVDLLEVPSAQSASLQQFTNTIYIAPGMTIYYADLRSTNSTITAESVNGLTFGDGKMVWVSSYAGANSSVDVALRDVPGGRSIKVNRALRFSTIIDSDADGIANGFDPFPFDPVEVRSVTLAPDGGVNITFYAAPQTTYTVQYRDSLDPSGSWKTLTQVLIGGTALQLTTVRDPAGAVGQRFYRILYTPTSQ
jgi:hypothetical protein